MVTIELAAEDAPPSNPAPWESHNVVIARIFPVDRRHGPHDRIVVYRLPITLRCAPEEIAVTMRRVLIECISHIPALPSDGIDDTTRWAALQLAMWVVSLTVLMPPVPTFHAMVMQPIAVSMEAMITAWIRKSALRVLPLSGRSTRMGIPDTA